MTLISHGGSDLRERSIPEDFIPSPDLSSFIALWGSMWLRVVKFPDYSAQLERVIAAQLRFQMLTSARKFSGMHSICIRARVASSIANSKRAANHDIGNAYHNAWFSRVSAHAPQTAPRESRSSYTYYVGRVTASCVNRGDEVAAGAGHRCPADGFVKDLWKYVSCCR